MAGCHGGLGRRCCSCEGLVSTPALGLMPCCGECKQDKGHGAGVHPPAPATPRHEGRARARGGEPLLSLEKPSTPKPRACGGRRKVTPLPRVRARPCATCVCERRRPQAHGCAQALSKQVRRATSWPSRLKLRLGRTGPSQRQGTCSSSRDMHNIASSSLEEVRAPGQVGASGGAMALRRGPAAWLCCRRAVSGLRAWPPCTSPQTSCSSWSSFLSIYLRETRRRPRSCTPARKPGLWARGGELWLTAGDTAVRARYGVLVSWVSLCSCLHAQAARRHGREPRALAVWRQHVATVRVSPAEHADPRPGRVHASQRGAPRSLAAGNRAREGRRDGPLPD